MRLNINVTLILILHRPTGMCLHDEDKSCPSKRERQKQHFQTEHLSDYTTFFCENTKIEV